jgi:hypothetical protein
LRPGFAVAIPVEAGHRLLTTPLQRLTQDI